jgi:hypothetical protein
MPTMAIWVDPWIGAHLSADPSRRPGDDEDGHFIILFGRRWPSGYIPGSAHSSVDPSRHPGDDEDGHSIYDPGPRCTHSIWF